MRMKIPHLDLNYYHVLTLLLFALIGLLVSIIAFTSFDLISLMGKYFVKLDDYFKKLDIIEFKQNQEKMNDGKWRELVVNDLLFMSGLITEHKFETARLAKEFGLNTTDLKFNGSNIIFDNKTIIPIPPSALEYFKSHPFGSPDRTNPFIPQGYQLFTFKY